jgi:hypothetical protein
MRAVRLSILACQWCKLPAFQQWAGVADEACARMFILQKCGVNSRSELDQSISAGRLFQHFIRRPYMRSQGVQP